MAFFSSKDLPNVRPVADFNFAATKVLDNRINFSRGSVGTYTDNMGVVRYASHNVPRFDHDPTTGESLGLLIEESRTNQVAYSNSGAGLNGAPYYGNWNASPYTDNFAVAPDGTTTAWKMTPTTPSSSRVKRISVTAGNTYTFSVWLKKDPSVSVSDGVWDYLGYLIAWSQNGSTVTSATTQVLVAGSSASQELTTEWRRFSVSYTAPANMTSMEFGLSNRNSGSGNPGYSVFVWGAQLEQGAFATSYIPTTGSTVTRSEDRAIVKREKFKKIFDTGFNSFSALVDYDNIDTVASGASNGVFHLWGETTGYDDRITVSSDDDTTNTAVRTRAIGGGGGIFANSDALSASSQAATQKFAFSWSVPDYSNTSSRRWAFSFSGEDVDVVSDTTGTSVPQITRLGLGINPTRLDEHGGKTHFKRVAIYNQVLTDEELKGLSAI